MSFHYFEINLIPIEDMAMGALLNQVVHRLHKMPGMNEKRYALTFPNVKGQALGSTLRIFGRDTGAVQSLYDGLSLQYFFRDYSNVGAIKSIEMDYSGTWIAFSRFRIPSKKSDRNNSGLHERRFREAQAMPFLHVKSTSTKREFIMRVKVTRQKRMQGAFEPNSYGFGSIDNPVWLPDIVNA